MEERCQLLVAATYNARKNFPYPLEFECVPKTDSWTKQYLVVLTMQNL